MKMNNRHHLIGVLAGLVLLIPLAWPVMAEEIDAGKEDCVVNVQDDTVNHPNSIRRILSYFNKDDFAQFCRSNWRIEKIKKITLGAEGLHLKGIPGASGLVIDGGNVEINARNVPSSQCAITVSSHTVTIKNLRIGDASGDAICITPYTNTKPDGTSTQITPNSITLENVYIHDAAGAGIRVAAEAGSGVNIGRGVKIIHTGGPGIHFQGPMEARNHIIYNQISGVDPKTNVGTVDPESVAFWANANNAAGLITPSELQFVGVQVAGSKIFGTVKACKQQTATCELEKVTEVLVYKVGENLVTTPEQCVALLPVLKQPFCNQTGTQNVPQEDGSFATQNTFPLCKNRTVSDFLACMGEIPTTTNLVGKATKVSQVGYFEINTKTVLDNPQDYFVLVPVDTSGFAGQVYASASCPFSPADHFQPKDIPTTCRAGLKLDQVESAVTTAAKCQEVVSEANRAHCNDPQFQQCYGKLESDLRTCMGDQVVVTPPAGSGGGTTSYGNNSATGELITVSYIQNGQQVTQQLSLESVLASGYKNRDECQAIRNALYGNTTQLAHVDSDHDGIPDIYEDRDGSCDQSDGETDLFNPDTDGDGIMDLQEMGQTGKFGYRECYLRVNTNGSRPESLDPALDTNLYTDEYFQKNVTTKEDPKTKKLEKVVPYIVPVDTTSGVPCFTPSAFAGTGVAATTSCTAEGLDSQLRPIGFSDGDQPGSGFCRGLDPTDGDTDHDGLGDGAELRPWNYFNPDDDYYAWDWTKNKKVKQIVTDAEGKQTFEDVKCDKTVDETAKRGRYFTAMTLAIKADAAADYDRDGVVNGTDNCPLAANADQADGDQNGRGDVCNTDAPWDGVIQDERYYLCMSESVAKVGASISNDSYSEPAKFNQAIGQTNPFNPDTDGDTFCDGEGGTACVGTVDKVPWEKSKDGKNNADFECRSNVIYNFIRPENRDAVRTAVAEFQSFPLGSDVNIETLGEEVRDFYIAQYAKIIQANGGRPLRDLDEDGIPDVIESPNGECGAGLSVDKVNTNPFSKDTDGDKLDDAHDPCPNVSFEYESFPSDDPGEQQAYEAELKTSAKQCGADNAGRYATNYALANELDWDADGLVNSLEDYDLSGGSPKKIRYESSVILSDTDGDSLRDDLELYVARTSPIDTDTDDDQSSDGDEVGRDGDKESAPNIVIGKSAGTCQDAGTKVDTDPLKVDTDGDGLPDNFELQTTTSDGQAKQKTNPNNADSDGDGLCDGGIDVENVCKAGEDMDGNGVTPVAGEVLFQGGVSESDPCTGDTDNDGRPDKDDECKTIDNLACKGGDIDNFDRDLDGIPDRTEVDITGTDPDVADSDNDGLIDGCERDEGGQATLRRGELCNQMKAGKFDPNFNKYRDCGQTPYDTCDTDPRNPDTDGDKLNDSQERNYPTNPIVQDTDGDCLSDGLEDTRFQENPDHSFTEVPGSRDGRWSGSNQGMAGTVVLAYTELNANSADTDGDGLPDGRIGNFGEDLNCDGITNRDANGFFTETSPLMADTDADGFLDLEEVTAGGRGIADISRGIENATRVGARLDGCSLVPPPGTTSATSNLWLALLLLAPLGLVSRRREAATNH